MFDTITNFIEGRTRTKTTPPAISLAPKASLQFQPERHQPRLGFSKIFRWPVPAGQTPQPTTVEVVGTFSDWHKVPLTYDNTTKTWHVTVNDIKSNHTHRYVIVIDGKPTYDKTCDGLACPQDPKEVKWQIETPKGPRVMLMFSQTK